MDNSPETTAAQLKKILGETAAQIVRLEDRIPDANPDEREANDTENEALKDVFFRINRTLETLDEAQTQLINASNNATRLLWTLKPSQRH